MSSDFIPVYNKNGYRMFAKNTDTHTHTQTHTHHLKQTTLSKYNDRYYSKKNKQIT